MWSGEYNIWETKKKSYQLKSIPSLNPKQQTDLVNNFPAQISSLAILLTLRLKKRGEGPRHDITWITGHIHRSIVDKIDPTSEYVEMVKKIYIINYIGLHSFNFKINLTENDSRIMSPSRFTAKSKNKILGKKHLRIRKTKNTQKKTLVRHMQALCVLNK
jgi:hypothetical protein